MVGRKQRSCE